MRKQILTCFAPFALFALLTSAALAAETAVSPTQAPPGSAANVGRQAEQLKSVIHQDVNEELDVPPVYRRPLGVDAGPRVHVRKFVVEGIIERPEKGITQEAIDKLVENLRRRMQNLHALNEYGLTNEDMSQLAERFQETLYESQERALKKHAELLEKLRAEKKFREEMSIGQLQEVANAVTDFYRGQGFVIAQAYVPEQTVEYGVVVIRINEGVMGKVLVEDNAMYSDERIAKRFQKLVGLPIEKEPLETELFALGDYPGLVAYGVLQPGAANGESDLVIKVQEERYFNYSLRFENYGSELTGEYRAIATYRQNNLFGNADDLYLIGVAAFEPAETFYGGFRYQSPLGGSDFLAGFEASHDAYDVGGPLTQALGISGLVTQGNIFLSYQFVRSRASNMYGRLIFDHKETETQLSGVTFSEDTVSDVAFEYGFDVLDSKYKGINQGNIRFAYGLPGVLDADDPDNPDNIPSGRLGASSEFSKLNWNLARLQLIDRNQNLLFRVNGQYSGDLLPPIEQMGMGGPNNVRAFSVSEYLRDTSVFVSIDWNFNAPGFYDAPAFGNWKWGEIFQLSAFADYAWGENNDASINTLETVDLAGVGVAAQLLIPGQFQMRLDLSQPVTDPLDTTDVRLYFTISYSG